MKNIINKAFYLFMLMFLFLAFKGGETTGYSGHSHIHATSFGLSNKDITGNQNRDAILESFDAADRVTASGNRYRTILLPPGRFNISNINFPHDYIHLKGAGMPKYNESNDSIYGGTLLIGGRLNLNDKYGITIEDMGVDVSGVSPRDAISSGVSGEGFQNVTIRNVFLKGAGTRHGIVLTSGGGNRVEHVEIDSFDHGVAFRGIKNHISDFRILDCKSSSVISKSTISGQIPKCYGNIIENGYCFATSLGSGSGIVLDANDTNSECYGNSISNVYMERVTYGVRLVGDGFVYNNNVNGIIMERPNQAGIYVTGLADNNSFGNIRVTEANGTSFVNDGVGVNNDIHDSYSDSPSMKDSIGVFRDYGVHATSL